MGLGFKDIINEDGTFNEDVADTGSDSIIMKECFEVIRELSKGDMKKVSEACYETNLRDPYCEDNPDGVPGPMRGIRS